MSDLTEKERLAGLEVKVDSIDRNFNDKVSTLDKTVNQGFANIQKQLATHEVQMENLVNNGLHQAQGISEIARIEVRDLKPKVETNQEKIHQLELGLSKTLTSKDHEDSQDKLGDRISSLEKKILVSSTVIGLIVFIVTNIDSIIKIVK